MFSYGKHQRTEGIFKSFEEIDQELIFSNRLNATVKGYTHLWKNFETLKGKGSCSKLKYNFKTDKVTLAPSQCSSRGYYLCESNDHPLKAYKIPPDNLMSMDITKFGNHPVNSITACSAYCAPELFFVLDTMCGCFPSFDATSFVEIQECFVTVPCPGNILEVCGCIEEDSSSSSLVFPIVQGYQNPIQGKKKLHFSYEITSDSKL